MAGTILKPLSNGLYTAPKGVAHIYPFLVPGDPNSAGDGERIGDLNSFTVEVAVEKSEIKSNEYGIATTVSESVESIDVTVTLECKQISNLIQAASVLGKTGTYSQDAATGLTRAVAKPGVVRLGSYGVTNVTMVDADGDALVLGTDFLVDPAGGQVQAFVAGTITYDVPEITSDFATGIASSTGIRGAITLRQVNEVGVQVFLVLHDVELTPSSAREFITSTGEPQAVTLTGKAYPVAGKPAGFEIGFLKEIPKAA